MDYFVYSDKYDDLLGKESKITPLGQRQHYLIGSELRRRFVDDESLLDVRYVISQIYVLAPQYGPAIQSVQAQMMGLYPANNQNDLTEWQQGNAVPPIKDADFSQWQAELGAKALPYGL